MKHKSSARSKNVSRVSAQDKNSLLKRYLLWLYKTTKDECDKIDRKFTQLEIDRKIEKILQKQIAGLDSTLKESLRPALKEWKDYIIAKEADAERLAYDSQGQSDPSYAFLSFKKQAVERVIVMYLGKKGLREIQGLYEEASVKRILEDNSGHR